MRSVSVCSRNIAVEGPRLRWGKRDTWWKTWLTLANGWRRVNGEADRIQYNKYTRHNEFDVENSFLRTVCLLETPNFSEKEPRDKQRDECNPTSRISGAARRHNKLKTSKIFDVSQR